MPADPPSQENEKAATVADTATPQVTGGSAGGPRRDANAFRVTVPEGASSGDVVKIAGPDGKELSAVVPAGVKAGETFVFRDNLTMENGKGAGGMAADMHQAGGAAGAPRRENTVFSVTVPEGVSAGAVVKFTAPDGKEHVATVPPGVKAGETFVHREGPAMEPFTVKVPEGAQPGDPITFLAPDGRPKTTHVPDTVSEDGTFEVMIPAPETVTVKVPEGNKGGDEFVFMGPDGRERKVLIPEGLKEGESFATKIYPSSSVEVKVIIPDGVAPGDEFQFTSPKGYPFTSRVPEDGKPGAEMTVRIPRGY